MKTVPHVIWYKLLCRSLSEMHRGIVVVYVVGPWLEFITYISDREILPLSLSHSARYPCPAKLNRV